MVFLGRGQSQLVAPILFGGLILLTIAGSLLFVSKSQNKLIESLALEEARLYSNMIGQFRSLYTAEVVRPAKSFGMEITHEYHNDDTAIPLPATLSMLLGEKIGQGVGNELLKTRLYSPYPFPWREDSGGLRDTFQNDAWAHLTANKHETYQRIEEISGAKVLRYAVADTMRGSCVSCHNSHLQTPKNDWRVGDVRGILEVYYPLAAGKALAQSTLSDIAFFMLALGLLAVVIVVFSFNRVIRQRRLAVAAQQQLTDANRNLEEKQLQLLAAQADLLQEARRAGMAEVSTGVLHNVGNCLNSVNTSANILKGTLARSSVRGLQKANQLLRDNLDNLGEFVSENPKGMKLMEYYLILEDGFKNEEQILTEHSTRLIEKIATIEQIIDTQQTLASSTKAKPLSLAEIVDKTLHLQSGLIARHDIKLKKNFDEVPPIVAEESKLIQILMNLFKNAKEAMSNLPAEQKQIRIRIWHKENVVLLSVTDCGAGIEQNDLEKIFTHGFTTKSEGHGFGLHSCARYMKDMSGEMQVQSGGPGQGATFVLRFPVPQSRKFPNVTIVDEEIGAETTL